MTEEFIYGKSTYELDTQARPPEVFRDPKGLAEDVVVHVSLRRLSKIETHEEGYNIFLWFPDNHTAVQQVSSLLELLKENS